jgi:hypothetical protein
MRYTIASRRTEALDAEGIKLSVWRIHRKIGMSGGLLTNVR